MPRAPIISGMLSFVSNNENNSCKPVIENCAPYDVTIEWNGLLGLLEIEDDQLIPLIDDVISSVCMDIHNQFHKINKKRLSREDVAKRCNLQVPKEFEVCYIDILFWH
jgi:hypothetical protein